MAINVLVADDHMLLRQGIIKVIDLESDLRVIGEAADGEEAVAKTLELKPDVLLLDINMPKLNGLEVIKRLKELKAATRVLVLTIHDDEGYVIEVIKSGAAGYLLKDVGTPMLVEAIRTVHAGGAFVYPALADKLFRDVGRCDEFRRKAAAIWEQRRGERLTARELEVLQCICRGMSNSQIAQHLFLSEKTVKNHLTNIFRKINVSDRTQAVLYAVKKKLVVLE